MPCSMHALDLAPTSPLSHSHLVSRFMSVSCMPAIVVSMRVAAGRAGTER